MLEPWPCTGHGYTAGPGEALPPQATLTSWGRGVGFGDSRAPAAAGRALPTALADRAKKHSAVRVCMLPVGVRP